MMSGNILIIEDDAAVREGVRLLLESEGFSVTETADGFAGLKALSENTRLVILDIMMPGISGIDTCKSIRQTSNVPVLFLTAKHMEFDKVAGFDAGGDDYLVKPFSHAELKARVKALLRRHQIYDGKKEDAKAEDKWLEAGNIRIHTGRNEVYLDGKEAGLTELEYRILLLLAKHPEQVFSIQNIYEKIWEEQYLYTSGNTVMVHIRRLRMKLEKNPQNPRLILNVWGKGYRFGKN